MKIIYKDSFFVRLNRQIEFIAKDNKNAALRFGIELKKAIGLLQLMPYKCRQSIYFEEKNIRDLFIKAM